MMTKAALLSLTLFLSAATVLKAAVINVGDFGAVGNGKADDTTALPEAAAALNVKGGDALWFPPGDYRTSKPLAIPGGTDVVGIARRPLFTVGPDRVLYPRP